MKINVVTCCKNEERMLPHFLRYYSGFCDSITVCDGNSTDKSIEIIKSFPKASILTADSGKDIDERILCNLKNTMYQPVRAHYDWQIVVDVDEFLYHPNLLDKLQEYAEMGVNLPQTTGYDMYSKTWPWNLLDIKRGWVNEGASKRVIFNPKQIDINYGIGCHQCKPKAVWPADVVSSINNELKVLHYKFISYDYTVARHKYVNSRLSDINKQMGWGTHAAYFASMTREAFDNMAARCIQVIE